LAFAIAVTAVVPFLDGHRYHYLWYGVGRKVLLLAMGLFLVFTYSAGTSFTFWFYLRDIKKIHRRFAPPGSESGTRK
jgi:hypothetical protein